MSNIDSAKIIRDYAEAFASANGKRAPRMRYENGWFVWADTESGFGRRYRAIDVQMMIQRLRARSKGPTNV